MRRTKAEAEQTRLALLEAARRLFAEHGVAHTSLEQVAREAGVTRGALYWHFANKAELFSALRDQALVPLFSRIAGEAAQAEREPLHALEDMLMGVLAALEQDATVRDTFALISLKCEYVGEFQAVLSRVLPDSERWVDKFRAAYREAGRRGMLRHGLDPELLALESQAFLFGLIRLWLMDEAGTGRRTRAADMIRCHVATRRA